MNIPTGWKKGRLGEECSIEIGGTPSRNVPHYWDDAKETTNLWVSIRDLNRREIVRTAEQITDAGVRHSNVKLQPKGAILLSFKLTIGRVAVAGDPLYTNEAIAALQPNAISNEYLYQGLHSWDLLQGVDQAIKGATLNKAKLKIIEFCFPESKAEQTKIADVLSMVDSAIEQTEALIAKQQRIKTGLMQDLLTRGIDDHGNIRAEHTHAFKDSALGRIPVEWDVVELGSMAEFVTSGSRGWAKYYSVEGALFLRVGNLTRSHINLRLDDLVRVSPPVSSEGKRTAVTKGDIAISITADLGMIGVIPANFGEAYVNQHIALVRPVAAKVDSRFVGWFLSSRGGQTQFEKSNESGAKAGLNLPTIKKLIIPFPSRPEQERVAKIVGLATHRLGVYQRQLAKLHALKAGLMQDLLTGKRRVTPLLEPADRVLEAV